MSWMVVSMADVTVIGSINKENVGCSVENTQMMNNSNIIKLFSNLFEYNYLYKTESVLLSVSRSLESIVRDR